MRRIKISTQMDAATWQSLRAMADASHQSISGLLTEAVADYVRRRRVRPEVERAIEASLEKNAELGRLLAR